ncbi:MAG: sensor histidine kinase [Thainema sp.]
MAWDIGSTPISNQRFGQLRNRLLLSYLAVIMLIVGAFSIAVYLLVARDRNQQLDMQLRQVASTAASSLDILRHEQAEWQARNRADETHNSSQAGKTQSTNPYLEHRDADDGWDVDDEYAEFRSSSSNQQQRDEDLDHQSFNPEQNRLANEDSRVADRSAPAPFSDSIENDRVHSITNLAADPHILNHQGVEWFDDRQQLIVREGDLFPSQSLLSDDLSTAQWIQQGDIRSFILPVYRDAPSGQSYLLGYVRASESTRHLDRELAQLREGLALGAFIISGLVTLGGVWLTREALKPVLISFDQLKQFTADASHELRNPLTAIRASIAVMQTHPERIHPADADKLSAIASASVQMSQLIDDLLLLARMDRQAPDRQAWHPIPLDELLEDLVNVYHDQAEQANIGLKLQLTDALEVVGDAAQLQRLFTNLLTNALRYTPTGGTVTVSLQRSGGQAVINIQDTGIGIAPEQLPHIFDRFWRADSARSQHDGGIGLGLAIAKAVVQRHDGSITVQSKLGAGSCFQVKLPLAAKT